MVKHFLGKEKTAGPIPASGSIYPHLFEVETILVIKDGMLFAWLIQRNPDHSASIVERNRIDRFINTAVTHAKRHINTKFILIGGRWVKKLDC